MRVLLFKIIFSAEASGTDRFLKQFDEISPLPIKVINNQTLPVIQIKQWWIRKRRCFHGVWEPVMRFFAPCVKFRTEQWSSGWFWTFNRINWSARWRLAERCVVNQLIESTLQRRLATICNNRCIGVCIWECIYRRSWCCWGWFG